MKKKTIRLISLVLAVVMAASAIVYVSADEQEGLLTELFSTADAGEKDSALSDSAIEAEGSSASSGETDEQEEELPDETEADSSENEAVSDSAETISSADLAGSSLTVISGYCGDEVEYNLYEDGSLVISGSGDMYDYDNYNEPLTPWYEEGVTWDITSITVESGVTSIGDSAFEDCGAVESISIADTVTKIGWGAFRYCESLPSIVIPDSVTYIDEWAFEGCEWLESVTLSENLEGISYAMFSCCYSLTSMEIPDSVTYIDEWAFESCESLETITIPATVTSIGVDAFNGAGLLTVYCYENSVADNPDYYPSDTEIVYIEGDTSTGYCGDDITYTLYESGTLIISGEGDMYDYVYESSDESELVYAPWNPDGENNMIKNVVISEGITGIGDGAFCFCYGITSVSLPSTLAYIGDYAFGWCISLPKIDIPDFVYDIGQYAFWNCLSLKSISIPSGVTEISYAAFEDCQSLTSVDLPTGLTSIGTWAFGRCSALPEIYIPGTVTEIGSYAFSYCTALTSITIPSSVTSIGSNAFYNSGLTTVYCPEGSAADDSSLYPEGTVIINAEYLAYGSCGDNAEYTITSDGVLTISGTGEITEYTDDIYYPWYSYNSFITSIVIEDGITNTGVLAFYGCTSLKSVSLGADVTSIGRAAFSTCSALESINIPEGVTSIGASAFWGTALKSVTLPETLETLDSAAFYNCASLESINIPESLTALYGSVFYGCTALKSITIPATVKSIGSSTFSSSGLTAVYCYKYSVADNSNLYPEGTELIYIGEAEIEALYTGSCGNDAEYTYYSDGSLVISGTGAIKDYSSFTSVPWYSYRSNIKSVTIESGITSIGTYSLSGFSSVTSIELPDTVTAIGWHAFYEDTALEEITIPDSVTDIDDAAFSYCTSLPEITIPDSVTTMGTSVFWYCKSLTSVTLPSSLTAISSDMFYGCSSLPSITIPESVLSINKEAFYNCTALESITIPYNVITIGSNVFYGCSSLEAVYCYEGSAADDSSLYPEGTELIYIGDASGKISVSGSCGDTAEFALYADGTLVISGTGAMTDFDGTSAPWYSYRSAVKSLVVEEGITSIGEYSFYACSSLTSAEISETVESIGNRSFYACSALTSIEIPNSVTNIGNYSFNSCKALADVSLSKSLETIGIYAFAYCEALPSVIIPDSVTSLGRFAFYYCPALAEVQISSGLTEINEDTFGYTALTEVIIPEGVKTIGNSAFFNCTSLAKVTIPDTVETIGSAVFKYCTSLKSIVIPDSVTSINTSVFSDCTALEKVVLSDNFDYVWNEAFYNCSSLKTLVIPDSVRSIGQYAFSGCTAMESLYLPEGITYIIEDSISGMSENVTVYCYSNTNAYIYAVNLGYNVYDLGEHEHEYENFATTYSCTEQGYAGRTCWICGYTVIDEYFGGEGHQFGDWVVESEATVFSEGYKYRECSVCSYKEEVYTDKIAVDIETDENYGLANFTVVDASTLEGISGVSMYITTENDGEGTVYCGSDGTASVILPVGKQTVTVSAEGYGSRTLKVTIVSGEQNIAKIGLGTGSLVEGQLTVDPMTYDEIIDAGIDVGADENNQVYKYTVTFEFGDYEAYFGSDGTNYSSTQTFYDSSDTPIKVTALSEHFYLVITGEVKWLKEMFDVQLLVINNSATDTIENCTAELVLPEGLSLAAMNEGEQTLAQAIDYVAEGATDTIHWYVCGDEEGEYDITAKLAGQLMPFEEDFSYEYTTDEPIKVYAGSALQMTIKAPGATYYNDDYTVTLELENVSDKSIYNLTHTITSLEQFKAVTYSGGYIIEEAYVDTDTDKVTVTTYDEEGKIVDESETTVDAYVIGSATADEFKPGDKLVIEVTSNIMFEGSRLTAKGAELVQQIEEAQKILDAYNAAAEGSEILNSAYNMLAAAKTNMGSTAVSDTKGEAYTSLFEAVNQLSEIILTGSSTALEMVYRLEKAGVYATLTEISQDSSYYENHTEDELNSTLKVMDAILRSCDEAEFETYSVFNILKAVAESIPVTFILEDVFVNTLEGSTTEIPYVIEITQGDYPVSYSVSAVSSYLYDILSSAMGSDVPRYVDIFSGNGSSYGDVTRHVIMTQNSTSTLAAESATGNAAFRAWIETADGNVSTDFTLTSDNETAEVSGGVLSFTGSGFINAVPSTSEGGTLYVEMTENGETDVTSYEVDVVSAHTCSGEWVSVIEPTESSEGYMVKVCDTCGDVIDIKTTSLCDSHSFGEYEIISEASETEYGLKARTCETCGYKQYTVIKTTNVLELTEESEMSIDSDTGYVTGTEAKVMISDFLENFENDSIVVYDNNGVEVTDLTDYIGTGFVVQNVYKNEVTDQLIVVIKGDLNSDGKKNVLDLSRLFDHVQDVTILDGYYLEASYITSDDRINVLDLSALFDEIQNEQ